MPSCTLEIGGRVVARAEGGPFDAEYALFEAHELELRSNNEPGTVREHGYVTTAELAVERLDALGATAALADGVAEELGALAHTYARGAEVRRVASLLGASELFEGQTWDPQAKRYNGAWLEIGALAADLGVENAGRALQALHLAALLRDVAPGAPVSLVTTEYTATRRPGERTHKRVTLSALAQLPDAIRELAESKPDRSLRDAGPARSELLEWVRGRKATCAREESTTRLEALERMLAVRERPTRGPLADADTWAVEQQMNDGDTQGIGEKLDALERSRGRQPGTTYLRARLALALGTEEPRAIAERASSLALSMSAFPELELLAAEAWSRAGETKRALAYARDLANNPQVDVSIRSRARALVEPHGSPSGERPATIPPAGPKSGSTPAVGERTARSLDNPFPARSNPPPPPRSSTSQPMVQITAGLRGSVAPTRTASTAPPAERLPTPPPTPAIVAPSVPATAPAPARGSSYAPAPLPQSSPSRAPARPPEPGEEEEPAPDTSIEPMPIVQVRGSTVPMAPEAEEIDDRATTPEMAPPIRPGGSVNIGVSRASGPHAMIVDAPPRVGEETLRNRGGIPKEAFRVTPPPFDARRQASSPPPAPPEAGDEDDDEKSTTHVKGGSLPPFRTEAPPPNFPSAPLIPSPTNERVERAEALSLPPGLHGESVDTVPTNPWEARIYFTQLSRELGRLYRVQFNVELRTDVRSIEILQRNLAERFKAGELRTPDDEREVRLHGAFLSEILARRLGAEWTDLMVSEMGYWSMNVPPGTRVWPIGRVIRYVTMQHRERDLVSYFLELQARASGLR